MKYLQPSFTIGQPAQVNCCERCVYGRGEHAEDCERAAVERAKLIGELTAQAAYYE